MHPVAGQSTGECDAKFANVMHSEWLVLYTQSLDGGLQTLPSNVAYGQLRCRGRALYSALLVVGCVRLQMWIQTQRCLR